MVLHELRIHYGAPSLVSDDAKWRTLANNIANFEASNTVRFTSRKVIATKGAGNSDSNDVLPFSVEPVSARAADDKIIHEQYAERGQVLDEMPQSGRISRKRKSKDSVETRCQAEHSKRKCFSRSQRGIDWVCKNSVTAYPATNRPNERTPLLMDKNIRPGSTVLVPFTASPKQRSMRQNTTPDPQCSTDTESIDILSSSRVEATSFGHLDSSTTEVLDHDIGLIQPGNEPLSFQTQIMQEDVSLALSQTSFCNRPTLTEMSSPGFERGKVCERLHQDASVVARSLSVSTESPSQLQELQAESSPLAHRSIPVQANVVDLTGEKISTELSGHDVLGSGSPAVNTNTPTSPVEVVGPKMIKRKLMALPKRIYCSAPINKFERFQSFVPESLRAFADKLSLHQKFCPVEAVERIRNGDRGYWKMLIRVTSLVVVAKSRRSPLSSSQWSDEKFLLAQEDHRSITSPVKAMNVEDAMRRRHYPNKCATTFTPWTLDEFVDFWALLRKTIGKGYAGYDVHATITDKLTEREDGVDMEVRLYGYAEALSHMWCILYVLSNKKAASMPMQWIGTGQGILIRMSGQPKGCGSTGRWTELSPGIRGSWGFVAFSKELDFVDEP